MNPSVRILSLWAINDRLDSARLRSQLLELQRLGYDGVVFHPRFFPNDPPYLSDEWMRTCSALILDSRDAGMEFWIYDENGWPSGTVGGELLRKFPDARNGWLVMDGDRAKVCRGDYLDVLNPEACRHFVEMTYQRYRDGLDPRAFEHVAGFFTDEPQYAPVDGRCGSLHGFVPWTADLPGHYRERYGEEIEPLLPGLFFDRPGCEESRVKFWELVSDLHLEAFFQPLAQWCRQHGKEFTGHVKGEEHPLFQLIFTGSLPRSARGFTLPGIDCLERKVNTAFYGIELRSTARQFGDGRCLVEAFGVAGWGAGPDDLLEYLTTLGEIELTHFVIHLGQSRLKSQSVFDCPPSIPFHVPWKDAFPDVLQEFRRRMQRRAREWKPASTLLIAPHRGVMAAYEPWVALQTNIHDGRTYPADSAAGRINAWFMEAFEQMRASGIEFDITDERTFEESARLVNGRLVLGKATYDTVVADNGCRFTQTGRKLLSAFPVRSAVRSTDLSRLAVTPGTKIPPEGGTPNALQASWRLISPIHNALPIFPQRQGTRFVATFRAKAPVACTLVLLDPIGAIWLNGRKLDTIIPAENVKSENELILDDAEVDATRPLLFCALRGLFRVVSDTPYRPGPHGTVCTDGPLRLDAYADPNPCNLVASGFPFLNDAVSYEAQIELPTLPKGATLQLADCQAAAAHVTFNGRDLGWTWGDDWRVVLPEPLAGGRHTIQVVLAPFAQNFFGPHHHVDGDPISVWEDQWLGRKNFSDRPDAPECTAVPQYHFKPFGVGDLRVISPPCYDL